MYEDVGNDDLNTLFADSVVRYSGELVYVHGVAKANTLSFSYFGTQQKAAASVSDPLFDFSPIPLGMCNCGTDALFLSRVPKRQFKQGLSYQAVRGKQLDGKDARYMLEIVFNTSTSYLSKCIKKDYPSLTEALEIVEMDGIRSVAFHKHFAITKKHEVFFKTDCIGVYSHKHREIVCHNGKEFFLGAL